MIRQFFKKILTKPVSALADKFDSRPDAKRVSAALTGLNQNIRTGAGKKGPVITLTNQQPFIILSDQHKGTKNGSDIFALAEGNYVAALEYYNRNNYTYINLGDGEELWENTTPRVMRKNPLSFAQEKLFVKRNAFIKVFGNHDLYWDNDPLAAIFLERIYGRRIPIYEGVLLQTNVEGKPLDIFLTHGHQGDTQSDGNQFSKWFIAKIWGPLQMYLELNVNTPSVDDHLKTLHNTMMYDWSAQQQNLLLVTGHTHQAVFESLTHLERVYRELAAAQADNNHAAIQSLQAAVNKLVKKPGRPPEFKGYKPTYFNSGCCCFNDGDITGIEIADGNIRLIKWEYNAAKQPERKVLEEATLSDLAKLVTSVAGGKD